MNLGYIDFSEPPTPTYIGVEQGTDEWKGVRAGKITASRIAEMIAGGKGLSRQKLLHQLAIERLTGNPIRGGFENRSMRHGNEYEEEAIDLYSLRYGVDVLRTGFVTHPTLLMCGCSPDALIGCNGLGQIKCPDQHTHLGYLLSNEVPKTYALQMQWEMACTNKEWNDFISYDPDTVTRLQLHVVRIDRDDKIIKMLETEAVRFNDEINEFLNRLEKL